MLSSYIALAFASLALAQTQTLTEFVVVILETGTSEVTTTSAMTYPSPTLGAQGAVVTHTISVGANGALAFSPPNIDANVGDVIQFEYQPKNHSVTQSSFGKPCETLENSTGSPGFDSGFMPTSVNSTTPTFSFVVNDTKPIWFYCKQQNPKPHCGQGMVGAINAPPMGNNTFAAFVQLAKNTLNSSSSASGSPSGGSTGTPTGTGASSSSTETGSGGSGSGSGAFSNTANIGLTAILAVAGVAILAL